MTHEAHWGVPFDSEGVPRRPLVLIDKGVVRAVTYDRDLGPGWKHLAAARRGARLELYVDGKLAAASRGPGGAACNLSGAAPLRIGFGERNYFSGKIREVRLYRWALAAREIARLAARAPEEGGRR